MLPAIPCTRRARGWWWDPRSTVSSIAAIRRRSSNPTLLHGGTARADLFGSPTTTDAATENGKENEATNASGQANDEGFVVIDPGADFPGCGGAFACALVKKESQRLSRPKGILYKGTSSAAWAKGKGTYV